MEAKSFKLICINLIGVGMLGLKISTIALLVESYRALGEEEVEQDSEGFSGPMVRLECARWSVNELWAQI